jgi:uncharacterized SAM-binding protein YcdF (DUF218 family)
MDIISYFVSASGLISLSFVIGLLISLNRRTRKLGNTLVISGAIVFLVFSSGAVSTVLLKPLEFKYAAYEADGARRHTGAKAIVLMAGYALDEDCFPVSSKVNSSSMFRIVEAFTLWSSDPSRQIIVSGDSDVPVIMAQVLETMGVTPGNILVENRSSNSYESAKNIEKIVQKNRFFLVTSAGHMPRCMAIFTKSGIHPIPVPTDYQAGKKILGAEILPKVEHLYSSELALHEYMGIVWYWLKGYI